MAKPKILQPQHAVVGTKLKQGHLSKLAKRGAFNTQAHLKGSSALKKTAHNGASKLKSSSYLNLKQNIARKSASNGSMSAGVKMVKRTPLSNLVGGKKMLS